MPETMEEFLARRHVAALATHNRDGSIQTAAVWYLHEGDSIYIATPGGSVKARNVRERGSASVMVDGTLKSNPQRPILVRVGHGYDAHRFGEGSEVRIGGISVPHSRGVVAHSDGDVVIHA